MRKVVSRKDNKGRKLREGESYRKNDGLYMFRWNDKYGDRKNIYANSLEKLREKEEKIYRDLADGIRVGERNITLNDVFELWKKDKINLKANTKQNYVYMYEHFVMNKFGELRIQEIRRSDVRRFYTSLIGEGRDRVSINTLESIHTVVHQVFKVAVEDGYIRLNPSDDMIGEIKRSFNYKQPRRFALDRRQQNAFLTFIKESNKYRHWYPIFVFMLGTGCRISEVIGLRWEDIHMDVENEYIDINHNLVYYKDIESGKCKYTISGVVKTVTGNRVIPLLPEVKYALIQEKKYQEEMGIFCNCSYGAFTDFVFLNRNGCNHNQQSVNRAIKRIVREYNLLEMEKAEKENREAVLLPNFSCHNLRHTFATRCCENVGNIKVIQSVMGYQDIGTTMDVYNKATGRNLCIDSLNTIQSIMGHSDISTTMDIYVDVTEEAINNSFSDVGNAILGDSQFVG